MVRFEEALKREAECYLNARFIMDGETINQHIKEIEAAESSSPSLVKTLLKSLKAERRKARIKHWTYSLQRHIALRQALERALNDAK